MKRELIEHDNGSFEVWENGRTIYHRYKTEAESSWINTFDDMGNILTSKSYWRGDLLSDGEWMKGESREWTYDSKGNELTYKETGSDYSRESTYDIDGRPLTYKDSDGFSYEHTYDEAGNLLTYKDSKGFSSESTYDKFGNILTYKDNTGIEIEYPAIDKKLKEAE